MMETRGDNPIGKGDHPALIEAARQEAAELVAMNQPNLLSPDAVPGYEILNEIGRGGMGVVYKALQLSTRRLVALKVMLAGVFASRHACKRFRREVELAARLQHPGIVRVLESNTLRTGQQYYAMELVTGQPLDVYVRSHEPDTRTLVQIFIRLCDAVHHAHEQGVIHRDLKPANIVIDAQGEPHVLDFGLAKTSDLTEQDSLALTISSPGQVLGTLRYLSPEQAEGRSNEVNARTDVYAIGVTLYQALTGTLPCTDTGNLSEIIRRITLEHPTRPSVLSEQVDGELETIILKSLEKAQEDRYVSTHALGEDLERYLRGEPLLARPPSRLYRYRKHFLRHRKRVIAIAVAVLVIGSSLLGIHAWNAAKDRQRTMRVLTDAEIALYRGRYKGAAEQARTAYVGSSKDPEALLVWAQARLRESELSRDEEGQSELVGRLESVLESNPSEWPARLLLSELLESKKDTSAAAHRQQALSEIPDTAQAWHLRSFATMDPKEALRCELEAIARDQNHARAWGHLAYLYVKQGDTKSAEAAADRLIQLGVKRPGWCLFQAEVLALAGRYDEADQRLTNATDMSIPPAKLLRSRAVLSLCKQEYQQSIKLYTDATLKNDDEDKLWQWYGRATPYWIEGHLEEAINDYRAVIREPRHGRYANARLYLVLLEYAREVEREGDPDKAASLRIEAGQVLANGLASSIADSQLMYIMKCFARQCSPQELLDSTNPEDIEEICENAYYAGEAYSLMGDADNACQCFQKCVDTGLVLDPDSDHLDPVNEYHLALWRLKSCGVALSDDATEE